jgi:hypothetical protein
LALIEDDGGTPGIYDGQRVRLKARRFAPNRPILLHELLHAYHQKRLPEGNRNPKVLEAFRDAPARYPTGNAEHFLENPNEFFACTASAYLFGTIQQAPYERKAIQERQPKYYEYLGTLFGPR